VALLAALPQIKNKQKACRINNFWKVHEQMNSKGHDLLSERGAADKRDKQSSSRDPL
jgi:hypothetical protein